MTGLINKVGAKVVISIYDYLLYHGVSLDNAYNRNNKFEYSRLLALNRLDIEMYKTNYIFMHDIWNNSESKCGSELYIERNSDILSGMLLDSNKYRLLQIGDFNLAVENNLNTLNSFNSIILAGELDSLYKTIFQFKKACMTRVSDYAKFIKLCQIVYSYMNIVKEAQKNYSIANFMCLHTPNKKGNTKPIDLANLIRNRERLGFIN